MENQIQLKSRQRVADHGEVFTNLREVNAMLDLVKQETERIDSRFLEPACGTGNFLSEILRRKLNIVKTRYDKNQFEFEFNALVAISSIYGIELLADNVKECRKRLFEIFDQEYYRPLYKEACKPEYIENIKYILGLNIVWGDALTMKSGEDPEQPIVFAEWSPINGNTIQRRDFSYSMLVPGHAVAANDEEPDIFGMIEEKGDAVYIPRPEKIHKPRHFLELIFAAKP